LVKEKEEEKKEKERMIREKEEEKKEKERMIKERDEEKGEKERAIGEAEQERKRGNEEKGKREEMEKTIESLRTQNSILQKSIPIIPANIMSPTLLSSNDTKNTIFTGLHVKKNGDAWTTIYVNKEIRNVFMFFLTLSFSLSLSFSGNLATVFFIPFLWAFFFSFFSEPLRLSQKAVSLITVSSSNYPSPFSPHFSLFFLFD
jgi:hypothetical protein